MLTGLKSWLWLALKLEPGCAWRVLAHFSSPERVYFADPAEYALIPRLSPRQREKLLDKSLAKAEQVLDACDRLGIQVLTWQDADYPQRLRNIELPPLVLYYRGRLPRFDEEIAIAMAGTRHSSPYGRRAAGELAYQITRLGGLVVTGIVEGCDRACAEAALKAGGPLACVLAGGVDVPYYNTDWCRALLRDVAACGVLLSEYPPGTPNLPDHFPARNRILTGLCLGTVCVEAPERSGTLKVAALALEQGRDVYAVPANIGSPASQGTNGLLCRGEAICVCSGADVLEHYWALYPHRRRENPAPVPEKPVPTPSQPEPVLPAAPAGEEKRAVKLSEHKSKFTDDEILVLRALEKEPLVTDAVVSATQLPARRASATLTVLTIRGLVRQLPGGRFEAVIQLT